MTITYKIGCILAFLAFIVALYDIIRAILNRRRIKLLPVLMVISTLLIIPSIKAQSQSYKDGFRKGSQLGLETGFNQGFNSGVQNSYDVGYRKAIEDACLVYIRDDGDYIISFNGEEHLYNKNNATQARNKGGVQG